ncbi:MAG: hypothetical protein GY941_02405 [Planctomycetes bacterium]|nr:hypothetical protein [Planctomycetota bacterium]
MPGSSLSNHFCIPLVLLLLWMLSVSPILAGSGESESVSAREAVDEFFPNHIAFVFGVAHEERRENGGIVGIEYERRLSQSFGIGALAEHTFGDLDFWVYAIPFGYHIDRWKVYVAPGIEDGHLGTEFMIRVGGEYAFEVGSWDISPTLDIDFVDGEQVLGVGVSIGLGF